MLTGHSCPEQPDQRSDLLVMHSDRATLLNEYYYYYYYFYFYYYYYYYGYGYGYDYDY